MLDDEGCYLVEKVIVIEMWLKVGVKERHSLVQLEARYPSYYITRGHMITFGRCLLAKIEQG